MHERNWGKLDSAVQKIEAARAAGVDVTADRYPYTAANTGLDAVLPRWALAGSRSERLARLTDPSQRRQVLDDLAGRPEQAWQQIVIAEVRGPRHRWCQGLTVAKAAATRGTHPAVFAIDLLAAERGQVGAIYHVMSESNLERILARDWVTIGSDSGCRAAATRSARGCLTRAPLGPSAGLLDRLAGTGGFSGLRLPFERLPPIPGGASALSAAGGSSRGD